ncbi:MAG: hypothetical protein OEV55_00420 [candidate division Zixibacteria bacterium]|nr:hypothetical protein [candidate division Zixibacteria bacterium]
MKEKIEREFKKLCKSYKRKGVIGFSPLKEAELHPIQKKYLLRNLSTFDWSKPITAISIGVFYTREEINSVPDKWVTKGTNENSWNIYSQACGELNRILNNIASNLAEKFAGISEQATVEGYTRKVKQVEEYYGICVSHRVFAEAAGLGWRGKSGLIITPENGSALRLSTIFIPYEIESTGKEFQGCGDCQACLDICPFLKNEKNYRQNCLLRLKNVGLQNEVCGICIRICREALKK